MKTELFTLKDLAAFLDVPPYRITYLITSRQAPEPQLRVGNVRVWTMPEIQVIADKLNIEIPKSTKQRGTK